MRDILNRMNYRLKRIRKGKPLKKTSEANAIFANVQGLKDAIQPPDTLEISAIRKRRGSQAITPAG